MVESSSLRGAVYLVLALFKFARKAGSNDWQLQRVGPNMFMIKSAPQDCNGWYIAAHVSKYKDDHNDHSFYAIAHKAGHGLMDKA